jgi:DNA-binding NarL/FixJ family response regulator
MLEVANSTVRNLLSGIYMKLGVHSRAGAIARARQMKILPAENIPD